MHFWKKNTGRWGFLAVTIVLLGLSLAYQQFAFGKWLDTLSTQSLSEVVWTSDSRVDCEFSQNTHECTLWSQDDNLHRYVAQIPGNSASNPVVLYRINLKVNTCESGQKIVLISEQQGVRQWGFPHRFFGINDSGILAKQGRLFFSQPIENLQWLIESKGGACQIQVKDLQIIQAQMSLWNQVSKALFIVLWSLLLIWVLKWLFQKPSGWNWLMVLVIAFLLFGTQTTKSFFDPIKSLVNTEPAHVESAKYLEKISPVDIQAHLEQGPSKFIVLTKVAHFGLFMLFTWLLWLRLRGQQAIRWSVVYVVLLAFSTEVLQAFGHSRSASLSDVGIDLSGMVLALILITLHQRLIKSQALE